ncbi:MAG: UvrD-helicase domain-containing protein, partial [Patescibacteria group bacterium]|nr:UvrD-helicase domain-containing protein [Patescibacteria group bacterium]
MNYLDGLNDAQREAVLATEGPVCVLAGAGAGKTKVLTTRIYHLIREGAAPHEILAVTFTNKAAREMRERVSKMLDLRDADGSGLRKSPRISSADGLGQTVFSPAPVDVPFIATFHGLGRELLESYGSLIGVPRYFSVYDRDDSEKLVAAALKELDVEAKELSSRAVLYRISKAKGEGLSASEFYERSARSSFGNRITAEAWRRYDAALAKEKALDFDDLIAKPVRLLEEHPEARRAAKARWRYLHIDEYQDTNELQERLASILAEDHGNIFVVGDGDQAIYGWRGAKMEHILEFEERYPAAKVVKLEVNYRSTKTLVEASNKIIEMNVRRKDRRSKTENEPGEPIILHAAGTAEAEARYIARQARALIRGGSAPEEVAVLYRTNAQSRALEEGFLREGVPYKLLGTRFFERREVKDALAWMRLALDPSREADKVRAAGSPPRGLGKVTLAKLAAGQRDTLRAADLAKVEQFERVIDELARAAETLPPSEFAKLVIEKSGMKRALFEEGDEAARERYENVVELAVVAARHDGVPGKAGIASFLAEAALASDQDELDQGKRAGVALMTVHAAKGLEFDAVFVAGMEEGLFPHAGMGGRDEDRDEEEERRLFYVAVTRAKKRLALTFARVRTLYGESYLTEPSTFLRDIDPA